VKAEHISVTTFIPNVSWLTIWSHLELFHHINWRYMIYIIWAHGGGSESNIADIYTYRKCGITLQSPKFIKNLCPYYRVVWNECDAKQVDCLSQTVYYNGSAFWIHTIINQIRARWYETVSVFGSPRPGWQHGDKPSSCQITSFNIHPRKIFKLPSHWRSNGKTIDINMDPIIITWVCDFIWRISMICLVD
jgi:hypothetical protein